MVSKKTKETKEYQEQAEQSAKPEGEIEQIILNKEAPEPQEREPTTEEQVIMMTDVQFRVAILEMLSEILLRLRSQDGKANE